MMLYIFVAVCALLSGVDAKESIMHKDMAPRGTPGKPCPDLKSCEDCIASHFCLWSEAKKFCIDENLAKPEDKACHKCAPKEEDKPKPPTPPPPPPMKVDCCDENEKSLHTVITAGVKDDLNGVVAGEAITITRKPREKRNYTVPEYRKVWMTKEEAEKAHEEAEKQAWTLKGHPEPKRLPVAETWQRYVMRRQVELSDEDKARERSDPSTILIGDKKPPTKAKEHPLVKADPLNVPEPEKTAETEAEEAEKKAVTKEADQKAQELAEKTQETAAEEKAQVADDATSANATKAEDANATKAEEPKPEEAKAEEPKAEEPKPEESKPEEPEDPNAPENPANNTTSTSTENADAATQTPSE